MDSLYGKEARRSTPWAIKLCITIFQTPAMFWPLIDVVIYFTGYVMIESFWTPYLKSSIAATHYQVALAFFITGGSYVLSSILSGPVRNIDNLT